MTECADWIYLACELVTKEILIYYYLPQGNKYTLSRNMNVVQYNSQN
jgi:hypothetical protein